MELSTTSIIFVAIYFLAVVAIGLWARKRETTGEFLIAGRKVGLFQTVASTFAVLGGLLLVGQAALAYDLGFGAMWLWVGLALGMIGLGLGLDKVKKLADEKGYLTLSDYIAGVFDNKSAVLSAVILFLAFFALLIGQFIAGGSLFAPLLGISYPSAVIILGVATLIYLLLGGFKAVVKTDFLQFLIMAVVFIVVLFNLDFGSYTPKQLSVTSLDGLTVASFVLIGFFTIFAAADIWQRVFAAASTKIAKQASYITAGLFFVFGIILSLIGMAARNAFPDIDSAEALFFGLFQLMPEGILALTVILVLAAIMSTIDTELFYLSSSIAKDFIGRTKQKDEGQLKRIIYYSLVILAIFAMVIAIFVSDIILLAFALLSLTLCVAPSIVASFFWKLKSNAVFLSMLAALISFGYLLVTGTLTPDNAAITLPAAVVFLIIGQILFKHKQVPSAEIG